MLLLIPGNSGSRGGGGRGGDPPPWTNKKVSKMALWIFMGKDLV